MAEHYTKEALGRTKTLYEAIRAWASARGDVSLIGGWAVYELVAPGKAKQSRDVDIILHSQEALHDLQGEIPGWNLAWRMSGRRMYPDAHFQDEDPLVFRLDVFTRTSNPTWEKLFGRNGANNIKDAPKTFLPSLDWMIADKLNTVHLRAGADAPDKRAKDLIDIHHLVFHNKANTTAGALARSIPGPVRKKAVKWVAEAEKTRSEYQNELSLLKEWLESA
jgi:hypothetical protein